MLIDELKELNQERQRKLALKEDRKARIINKIHNTNFHHAYQALLRKKEASALKKYDRKTQKIIKNMPQKLKTCAKNMDYVDVHIFHYNFLINPFLYPNLATDYLDRRGKDITTFLQENNIMYYLHTQNNVIEGFYSVRVVFKK